jgi:ATP-dependent exoDNAse (exonuclease V) beta subunit
VRVRVASAGTGKTTSLVRRYLELVGDGTPLRRIAGVTFTRSAAAELRARVADGLQEVLERGSYLGGLYAPAGGLELFEAARRELGGALLKTIHGFMIAGLRLSAPLLSLDPRFAMVAEPDAKAEFAEELDSLRLVARDPDHPLHRALLVAGAHAAKLPVEVFARRSLAAELVFDPDPLSQAVGALYRAAYARLLERYAGRRLGPGEVERAALRMLEHPAARERLVRRYPVVLVDEFQDVNPLQGEFFARLEDAGARVEVVGDPKQSIYLFRNADVNVFRRALAAARASSDVLPPLTESRRHSRAIVAVLNRLTTRLARVGKGFVEGEAPEVVAAGPQAEVPGSVELGVVVGEGSLDGLRSAERELLASRLVALHEERRVPFSRMAVLARTHGQLAKVQAALRARGVPTAYGKRGLFRRQELLDVRYALEVGAGGGRDALAPFLRGPLCELSLAEVREVLGAPDPFAALGAVRPEALAVVEELRRVALAPPLAALKTVLRDGLAGRPPLVARMSRAARANVDAMLFAVAAHEPADLGRLIDLLDDLARRSEEEEVPVESGGVRLLTVHSSKGLEFDVVAVYDASKTRRRRTPEVVVDPATGRAALLAAVPDAAARASWARREDQEDHRLLYVALSRARDHLLVTGSKVKGRAPQGWLATLLSLGLEREPPAPHVSVVTHEPGRFPGRVAAAVAPAPAVAPSTWAGRRFPHHRHAPLSSPSRLVDMLLHAGEDGGDPGWPRGDVPTPGAPVPVELEDGGEPLTRYEAHGLGDGLPPAAADYGEDGAAPLPDDGGHPGLYLDLPGRGRVVGTLVHFAISQDWAPDPARLESLKAHEVMFPYAPEQQDDVLREVAELLAGYRELLGGALPALEEREVDRAELPLAYPGGSTVWEGVIDRLYRVAGEWWIDDYKTDRRVRPERYHVQLGLYRHAVAGADGAAPRTRLVYLRSRRVVELGARELDAALRASGVLGSG